MTKAKGIYKRMGSSVYSRVALRDESKWPIMMVRTSKYTLIQTISTEEKGLVRLYMFRENELCMSGWNLKKISKKEMVEELKWCIEKYEEDLRKQNNEQ